MRTGAADILVFDAYAERALRPRIKPGDALVLGNLTADKANRSVAAECGRAVI